MPTDFSGSFRDKVDLTKKHPTCAWKRHFDGALLEVMYYLVMLARRDPVNHYVYVRPKGLAKMCKGKYRKGKKKGVPLSESTVKKCLHLLEQKSIVSRELSHSPGEAPSEGFKSHLRGRVVTPHDNLCQCYPKICRYVGPGKIGMWMPGPKGFLLVADEFADVGASDFGDSEGAAAYRVVEDQ